MKAIGWIASAAALVMGVAAQVAPGAGLAHGRVLDARGNVMEGATVILTAEPSHEQARVRSKRDGSYASLRECC